jgi:tRNA-dihydrouridine synthase B
MKIRNLNLANNILLAPMAGITDLPSRLIARQSGVGLAFTEMVSANGLIREGIRTVELLRTVPEDRPLGIQLFGRIRRCWPKRRAWWKVGAICWTSTWAVR